MVVREREEYIVTNFSLFVRQKFGGKEVSCHFFTHKSALNVSKKKKKKKKKKYYTEWRDERIRIRSAR